MVDINSFELIEGCDPEIEDDILQCVEHDNFHIQILSADVGPYKYDGYVVTETIRDKYTSENGLEVTFKQHGEFDFIAHAIKKINELIEAQNELKEQK